MHIKNINEKIYLQGQSHIVTINGLFNKVQLNLGLHKDECNNSSSGGKCGIIIGDIFQCNTKKNIVGAIVSLFQKNFKNSDTLNLITLTYTNEYGQFAFKDVAMGIYIIKINALGYNSKCIEVFISKKKIIYPLVVSLDICNNCSDGTVSGIIMDIDKIPIERADVILYEVKHNESLMPIAFTKTNKSGVYLFMNVPKGVYKIKSNESKYINVPLKNNCTKVKNPLALMKPLNEDNL